MSARKQPYSAKAKVWLPNYTMELEGPVIGVMKSIFGSLPAPQRMLAIHQLTELHNSISEEEANKDTAA